MSVLLAVPGPGLGTTPNFLYCSSFLNDVTGTYDSSAQFSSACNTCALGGIALVIDCPVYLQRGTTATQAMVMPANLCILGTAAGSIITDGVGVSAFLFLGSATNI